MKRIAKILSVAFIGILAVSCANSKINRMKDTGAVKVECDPEVLQLVDGKIDVTYNVVYPAKFFQKEAIAVITPVLVYEGGRQKGKVSIHQGEKIKDNNWTVPYAGGSVKDKASFEYAPGVEKSTLELRVEVLFEGQNFVLPAIKIADGCNTTSLLVDRKGEYSYRPDGYEPIVHQTAETQIYYRVNSSDVMKSQFDSYSIQEFRKALADAKESDRHRITGTQVIAYASPEGGQSYNKKLSDRRAVSAEKAWGKVSKDTEISDTEIKSIGQDWEGFREAVQESNIRDKDLILRVLSMYSDPAVREKEIKNLSKIYTELKEDVFPYLRRARYITHIDFQNYSEEELKAIAEKKLDGLDETAILKLASMSNDPEQKSLYYRYAAENLGSQNACFDLAVLNLDMDMLSVAEVYIGALRDQQQPDVINLKGVIAMRRGEYEKAVDLFRDAESVEARANIGNAFLYQGKYAKAAQNLSGTGAENEALALLFNGDFAGAKKACTGTDARSEYIKAIIAARQGKAAEAKAHIVAAGNKDSKYAEKAEKDIEFAGL